MEPNPRYDVLFEPVRIGPVTAPNRFYQTPHAAGLGYLKPHAAAALRGMKAEGGWGVVSTEYCSIHPSSDDSPFGFLTLWDDEDVKALALTTAAVHAHGSLAAVELWHGGSHSANRMTREAGLAPSSRPAKYHLPVAARTMDQADIRAFRTWQRAAARRAVRAGFDIVYVYAGHDYLPFQFLSRRYNQRTDEYGGSLENRVRLIREMLEDTREAVAGKAAVALRLAVDELHGPAGVTAEGEGRDAVAMLAELPDLWDVNIAGSLGNDSRSSRFGAEGFQREYISFVKHLTSKPVVSVGRYTSPDTMVELIRSGVQDLIGAARPSIADPFLPRKIAAGRADEIRECIGCNICRSANNEAVHLRCSQNPTIAEEWRKGWHPERMAPKRNDARLLVVGGGPAGLEAALSLARRGHEVALAEASRELGGRILNESALPGLAHWIRVRDHRVHMLSKLPNAAIFRESPMTAADIADFDAGHVVVATGSRWRRDGVGAIIEDATPLSHALTPDDIFAGAAVRSPVVIYDDEHYALAGALAERLRDRGHDVTVVTPAAVVSAWAALTDEQSFIQKRLIERGVAFLFAHAIAGEEDGAARFACVYTGRETRLACATLIAATGRIAQDDLYTELMAAGFAGVTRVGDCLAPSTIADAVYSGHRFAREFGETANAVPRRERPRVEESLG